MTNSLFNDFDDVSEKQWKQKIQADLKGKDYNDTLNWQTPNNITVKPFYTQNDIKALPLYASAPASWDINETIVVTTESEANASTLKSIQSGVNSVEFVFDTEDIDIVTLLKNINTAAVKLIFNPTFLSIKLHDRLNDFCLKNNADITVINDPINQLAKTGNWFESLTTDFTKLNTIQSSNSALTSVLTVHSNLYQNSGATAIQELAYALSHANEYANYFKSNLNTTLHFITAVGSNYFFEIAKLRALRLLWATLSEAYGLAETCLITAVPSSRNKTIYDYNTNLLRTTTEYMSGILGGANTIKTYPYDSIYKSTNEFSQRIARNQLLILKEESHFDKVSNPADGAYYIETLTHQLAEQALALFKSIEKGGGFITQLIEGKIQKKITESAQAEQEKYNANEIILLGSNKHPNLTNKMKAEIDISPFNTKNVRKTLIQPILPKRLASTYEKTRLDDE